MDRQRLIDRKHEVQARIRELRPRVESAQREAKTRRERAKAEKMQRDVEGLMAEESRLRQEIDRTGSEAGSG